MATGTTADQPAPPPVQGARSAAARSAVDYESYIAEAVDRTSGHVKLVDVASAMMTLTAGALGLLLAIVIVDHWLMPLGFWGRLLAFGLLLGGAAYYAVTRLAPPLLRRINPLYAAHTIEKATPSLKNSLIDFLLLRGNRTAVREAVYEAMEAQTATELSHTSIDAAVDRSHVIKVGYLLTALVVVCALYTVLSPKNPLTTVARVVAPWQEIAPPSRVSITDVAPGDTVVFLGESVSVTAKIDGIHDDESALLVYSTTDGRVVDQQVTMQVTDDGMHFAATLPSDSAGVQQDLTYAIVAGDARTVDYFVTVESAPSIVVRSIEYEFPAYTRRALLTSEGQGDIKALEGTRVTIHAVANRELQRVYLDFDPHMERNDPQRETLRMRPDGREATVSFVLELATDEQSSWHDTYRLRFLSSDGQQSERHIEHAIDVLPDLTPEVEILRPEQREVTVPEDGYFEIEMRARDPDFALRRLLLRGKAGEVPLPEQLLLDAIEGHSGQAVEEFVFVPREFGLREGDRATYWAVAEDNRLALGGSQPEPNVARTPDYTVIIGPPRHPDENEQQDEEQQSPNPGGENNPFDQPEQGQEGEQGDQGQNGEQGEQGEGQPQQGEGESSDQSQGNSGDQQQSPSEGEQGESGESGSQQQSGDNQSSEGDSGEQSDGGGEGERQQGTESGEQGDRSQQPESGQGSSSEQGGEPGQQQPSDGSSPQGGQPSPQEQPFDTGGQDDGNVIEQLADRARQEQENGASGEPGQQHEGGEQSPESDQNTEQGESSGEGSDRPDGEGSDSSQTGEESDQGMGQSSEGDPAAPEREDGDSEGGDQQSGETTDGADTSEQEQPGQEGGESQQGSGMGDTGNSGAGQSNTDDTGAGESQDQGQQREHPDRQGEQSDQEGGGESPSGNDQDSDSQGDQPGDLDGGGGEGGGQGSNQAGHDSAGQNAPSDEGNSGSNEQGPGDTGEGAGDQQEAQGETGQSGESAGQGSSSGEAEGEAESGDSPPAGGESGSAGGESQGSPEGESQEPPEGDQRGGSASGAPLGGGQPSDSTPEGDGLSGDPGGDEANLDYAREATDLALEYLKDADERELEELLGWDEAQRQQFLERWQQMERDAERSEAGQRDLEEALRSLGLRRPGATVRTGDSADDTAGGLSEDAARSEPPAEYRDLYDAYRRSGGR